MSILIATPCYNGQAIVPFIDSCYFLKKELDAAGIEHDFLRLRNESLITRARNVCAASFLHDTSFSCLLFIDADIEFSPADVARLWNLAFTGADVAVGHYRYKKLGCPDTVWVDGKRRDLSEFDEPFEVSYAGTGFMLIKRGAFEQLVKLHPDWEYEEGFPEEGQKESESQVKKAYAFFQDPIEDSPLGRFHLSEDYFFCKRVREAGMKVVMDPKIELKHWGFYAY